MCSLQVLAAYHVTSKQSQTQTALRIISSMCWKDSFNHNEFACATAFALESLCSMFAYQSSHSDIIHMCVISDRQSGTLARSILASPCAVLRGALRVCHVCLTHATAVATTACACAANICTLVLVVRASIWRIAN
jgi:hypothetical protein